MTIDDRAPAPHVSGPVATPSSDRLLAVALEEFAEFGFHGSTTRGIARRVGLSSAALYSHFSSKSAILFELVSRTHLDVLGRMQAGTAGSGTPRERLERVVKAHVRFHAEKSTAARVANYELHSLSRDQNRHVLRMRTAMEDIVAGLLDEGIRAGEFNVPDPAITTIAILSLGIDVCRWSSPAGRLTASQLGDEYWTLVARMVGVGLAPEAG